MKTRMRTRHGFYVLMAVSCAADADGPPPLEMFREVCEPYFACTCEAYRYRDVDICMTVHRAKFAEAQGAAEAVGLHTDLECYLSQERPGEDRCLGLSEFKALHPDEPDPREPNRCGECQAVYGELQAGDACLPYPGGSDCAQGLLCRGDPGTCVDPCNPTPLGERCWFGTTICGPGRVCDFDEEICVELKGLGEPCSLKECADGFVCDFVEEGELACVVPPALGASCETAECSPEHECIFVDGSRTCRTIPGEGEPCEVRCVGDLWCDYKTKICMRWRELGDPCDESMICAVGLTCDGGTCKSAPGTGEPCDEDCALGLECVDAVCTPETPLICVM